MKTFAIAGILFIAVCLTFSACNQPLSNTHKAEIEKEITTLTLKIFDQFNNRDTGNVYTNYFEDCVVLSRGGYLIKDAGEFNKYIAKAKQSIAERDPFKYEVSDLYVDVYSEDVASVYYKYTSTNMYEGLVDMETTAASTWTFVKNDGVWKIKHAHISAGADRYRAVEDERVRVLVNKIKADKKEEFESLIYNDIMKNGKEAGGYIAEVTSSGRILESMEADEDGNLTYLFILDPFIEGVDYNIRALLGEFFSKEEVNKKVKLWEDCYAEPQTGYSLIQK